MTKHAWGGIAAMVLASLLGGCSVQVGAAGQPPQGHAAVPSRALPAGGTQSIAPVVRIASLRPDGQPATLELSERMVRKALESGALTIERADGTSFPVRMERGQDQPFGRWSAIGKVATRFGPQSMVLTFHGRDVFGVLPLPDGTRLSITTRNGLIRVAEDGGMVPKDHAGSRDFALPPAPSLAPARAPSHANAGRHPQARRSAAVAVSASAAPAEIEVDLLGLYTDELVQLRGSASAAETELIQQVAVSNQAHIDSHSPVRFVLKGMQQVSTPAGDFNGAVLDEVTGNELPGVDLVALRDQLAADLVFLVRPHEEDDPTCGIAWLSGGSLQGTDASEAYGYSVSNVGELCGAYVVAHEIGHNLGSMHDRATADAWGEPQYGAFPFSFGYRQEQPAFATIMAYQEFRPWVGYFSSPGLSTCGAPCGVADQADNVRSLRLMASAIAAFRGTPGTLSIADAGGLETRDGEVSQFRVPVRLSGPAPATGVSFRVEQVGGSAVEGVDFDFLVASGTIPAGEREAYAVIDIPGDDDVEGDRSLELRLADVVGAEVEDAQATVTIHDDDPRPVLSGKVRFEPGTAPPVKPFEIAFWGTEWVGSVERIVVAPPDFAYSIPVATSAEVRLTALPPTPWSALPLQVGWIGKDTRVDFPMRRGPTVSGRVVVPDGMPQPSYPIQVRAIEFEPSVWDGSPMQEDRVLTIEGPGDPFAFSVVPGAYVTFQVSPNPPYATYQKAIAYIPEDTEAVLELSTLPSLTGAWFDPIWEGGTGQQCECSYFLYLSEPSTQPVTFSYRTRDGTATAGQDYLPVSGTITIPAGETFADIPITILYDDDFEAPKEYWDLLIENVKGASVTTPVIRQYLFDRDARTGGPGQKQQMP